jgi:Ca2+-binding EF-hand superfamily protein
MNIKVSALVATVTLSMSFSSVVVMAEGPLNKMDKNGDGVVTKDEFQGPQKRFDKIDLDKDGKLTDVEFKAQKEKRQEKGGDKKGNNGGNKEKHKPLNADEFFISRDKNKDGKLDKTELPNKNFDNIDLNKDGSVSKEEVNAMPRFMSPEEQKAAHENRWFENRDKDKNGSLDRAEFYGKNGDPFSRLDKNGDGKLSKEEAEARFNKKNENRQNKKEKKLELKKSGNK